MIVFQTCIILCHFLLNKLCNITIPFLGNAAADSLVLSFSNDRKTAGSKSQSILEFRSFAEILTVNTDKVY